MKAAKRVRVPKLSFASHLLLHCEEILKDTVVSKCNVVMKKPQQKKWIPCHLLLCILTDDLLCYYKLYVYWIPVYIHVIIDADVKNVFKKIAF